MPAGFRTKNTYTTPTGVTVVRDKSGVAKKAYGKGKAPKGLTKVAEPTAATSPTVTVSPTGAVSTSGFKSQQAARGAVRQQKARSKIVRSIMAKQSPKAQKPSQSVRAFKAPELAKPKPVSVKSVPVSAKNPATAVMSSVPGKGPKVTQQRTEKVQARKREVRRELRQAKRAVRKSATRLPGLDREQEKVARKVLRVGKKMGATKKELLAAAQTGLVESGFRNLPYGDADSSGWRQERAMYYPDPQNVGASARRFFEESVSDTKGARGRGQTAGQLAQTIQASAFPERYDERKPEAWAIVKAFEQGNPKAAKRLQAVKSEAKELGMKVGGASKKVVTRFKAAQQAARELEKAKLPYVWGGGHGDSKSRPTGGGLDCSGAVGYVLNKMGAMKGSLVSGEFGSVLEPGPGAVTVFYNPTHVFMRIGNRYFGTSRTNPGGGAGWIDGTPDDLSKYSVGHVPGLGKKVALQMGISLPKGGQSFPGMTFSSSGTTATIDSGVQVDKPGFSKQPITARIDETNEKLKALGVAPVEAKSSKRETSSSVLSELARKYGVAA